jgi:hypothetical protein
MARPRFEPPLVLIRISDFTTSIKLLNCYIVFVTRGIVARAGRRVKACKIYPEGKFLNNSCRTGHDGLAMAL